MLRTALAITLLTSLASVAEASEACAPLSADVTAWPIVRSSRVPGLTLRLPRNFVRDTVAVPVSTTSSTTRARWADASRGQLVISRGESSSSLFGASADSRLAYSRCEERVGSAVAVIESYRRAQPAGAFVVQARLRWPDGEELVVFGDAADGRQFGELLAAVRTIRRATA